MSKETEKMIKKLAKCMNEENFKNDEKLNFIDFNDMDFEESPEMKSDDLLDAAYDAPTEAKAKKLAKEALEVYPDNIDAKCFLADFEEDDIKRLKLYNEIVADATKLLEKENMFDEENIGEFWRIIDTRPYMRARFKKASNLFLLSRFTEAVLEYEDMLRLCASDNMGVRYKLMVLYCLLERFEDAEKLYKRYDEYSTHMMFYMAYICFKKGDYTNFKKYLKKMDGCNKYIYKILKGTIDMKCGAESYSLGSLEEASIILEDAMYLIVITPLFVKYLNKYLE